MQKIEHLKVEDIKAKVIGMLEERHSIENNSAALVNPSKYWSDFCACFDYMLELSDKSFTKLRLHTYHLTGDNYLMYYFGSPEDFLVSMHWQALVQNLPSKYVLNEPEDGIGHRYSDNRFISSDVARFQRVVSSLYRHNIFTDLLGASGEKKYVLEVGGGYGGLAYHLSRIIEKVVYIIVDLPETLLYSASYLAQHYPQKRIYLYDKSSFPEVMESSQLVTHDFILLPNYQLQALADLRFDLVVNVASLQEMRTAQAETYLDFIQQTCRGFSIVGTRTASRATKNSLIYRSCLRRDLNYTK